MFPEGTRNTTDETLLPFKSGIYHLAHACPDIEFVPVWIENLSRVMPKGKLLPVPLLCTLTFGAPSRSRAGEEKDAFVARTRDALLALRPPRDANDADSQQTLYAVRRHRRRARRRVDRRLRCSSAAWRKGQPHATIDNLNARIKAWWVMVLVIGLAFVFGRTGVILLFAFISFFALREFITLTYTRRADHLALAAALLRRAAAAVRPRLHRLVRPLLDLHPGLRVPAAADPRGRSPATPSASSSARRRSSGA